MPGDTGGGMVDNAGIYAGVALFLFAVFYAGLLSVGGCQPGGQSAPADSAVRLSSNDGSADGGDVEDGGDDNE
jgi:hypothetical protein